MSRLFRDVGRGSRCPHGSVVCIGAFDGLHLGHRALVRHAVERARALGVPAVALGFEPLPRELFARGAPPPRLLSARAKAEGLCALGIDQVGLLRFSHAMAAVTAEDFVRRVLVDFLHAREVWVGPEFRFGKARGGDLALLQRMGAELAATGQGFTAGEIEPVRLDGERVSANRIRAALQAGDFDLATRLLGRPFSIGGRVIHGAKLGRTLGYPTANLRLPGKVPPLAGIHAVRVHGIGADPLPGVSSLGTRPSVAGTGLLLEVHLFDFDADLYGRRIEVEFVAKLRDEEKFDDLLALTVQMQLDEQRARAILSQDPTRALA